MSDTPERSDPLQPQRSVSPAAIRAAPETDDSPEPPAHEVALGPSYKRLTYSQLRFALQERIAGKSSTQIAQALNVNPSTIRRALTAFREDTSDLAIEYAKGNALRVMRRTVKMTDCADPRAVIPAAKLVFAASGVIKEDTATQVNVAVVLGLPPRGSESDASPAPLTLNVSASATGSST